MVLIATVSKNSVTEVMPSLYHISLNMVMTDNGTEVINKNYCIRYRPGDSIAAKRVRYTKKMQYDIDKYKSEQAIYNAATFDNVVANVEAGLEV